MLTLIPPPVDPDAGPMNIRMVVTVTDSGLSARVSSAAKPALRGVIEANSAFTTLSTSPSGPSVRGFDHSTTPMTTAPATIRTTVAMTTSLVSTAKGRQRRRLRRSPAITNPSPPITISSAVVSSISGWLAKTVNPRPPLTRSKPALLKALVA